MIGLPNWLNRFRKQTAGGGGGGPNTWFDSATTFDSGASLDSSGPDYEEWCTVVVGTGGTANSLRVNINVVGGGGDTPIKMALYDNSGNLIVSGTATAPGATADAYVTVSITPTPVSAGTYKIAFAASSTGLKINTKSGANGSYHTDGSTTYSSFPTSTLPTEDGHVNQFLFGVFVQ